MQKKFFSYCKKTFRESLRFWIRIEYLILNWSINNKYSRPISLISKLLTDYEWEKVTFKRVDMRSIFHRWNFSMVKNCSWGNIEISQWRIYSLGKKHFLKFKQTSFWIFLFSSDERKCRLPLENIKVMKLSFGTILFEIMRWNDLISFLSSHAKLRLRNDKVQSLNRSFSRDVWRKQL